MACMCVAFGGTKVAEAAGCPHTDIIQTGDVREYKTTEHTVTYIVDNKKVYDVQTGIIIEVEVKITEKCLKTVQYSDVTLYCRGCQTPLAKWVEKKTWHTNPRCNE